MERYTGAAAS